LEDRIITIEEKLAHLEKLVGELNQMIWELNQQVAAGRKELRDLRAQATPVDPNRKPDEEVPPHYGR